MFGQSLEQFTDTYTSEQILELSDFLVYLKDRVGRADLFEDVQRKMNIIYHQVWYFRDKLIRNYAGKDQFEELPKHLNNDYNKEAEESVRLLLQKDDSLRVSITVPDFLIRQIDNAAKQLSDADYYVTKSGDQYLYNGVPLDLKMGTDYRLAFDILFDLTGGLGGVCKYQAFDKELKKRSAKLFTKLKTRSDAGEKGLRDWSQTNLTVKSKGVLSKVAKKDLVTTRDGVGFEFNNQK